MELYPIPPWKKIHNRIPKTRFPFCVTVRNIYVYTDIEHKHFQTE